MSKKTLEEALEQELLRKHLVSSRDAINKMLDVSVPVIIQAQRIHAIWAEHAARAGWEYGLFKDPDNRRDPRLLPFNQLSEEFKTEFYDIASGTRDTDSMN